jgi:hypothetical protein
MVRRGSVSGMDAEAFVARLVLHLRLEALVAAAFSNGLRLGVDGSSADL